ncbi:MAG: GyrI-like domain-containing protein [Candidatus Pelagadaptatus aseana]|uniref:GyrI-like domain-containing protein n=1 Tax=Candidatus Pelagadaptatus aseana TaxID=3120508 RepID=UPI0039B2CFD7
MKYEWRKKEKSIYIPKATPEIVDVPSFNYFAIDGQGNPNDDSFSQYIEALYSVAYTVRMSHKSGFSPSNYFEYTVYPLEGVWDISEEAKQNYNGKLDKDSLVYSLMIRQPEFVTEDFANQSLERALAKKKNELIRQVKFKSINDGLCVQMLHKGSFDDEPKSFEEMEHYCAENGLARKCKKHREIYLSDFRKTETGKLKTTLRFQVENTHNK